MDKLFRYILIATIFLSCKKEDDVVTTDEEHATEQLIPLDQLSRVIPERMSRVMKQLPWQWHGSYGTNNCYPEEIYFGDSVLYSDHSFKRNNILYDVFTINYGKTSGLGVVSGLIYRGGGQVREVWEYFPDGSTSETVSEHSYYATYNGHYVSWNINYKWSQVNDVYTTVYDTTVQSCN